VVIPQRQINQGFWQLLNVRSLQVPWSSIHSGYDSSCGMDDWHVWFESVILLWLSNQYPHISTWIIVLSSITSLFFTAHQKDQPPAAFQTRNPSAACGRAWRLAAALDAGGTGWEPPSNGDVNYDRDGHPWCFKLYPRYITYFMGFPFGTCSTNRGLSWIVYVEGSHLLWVLLQ